MYTYTIIEDRFFSIEKVLFCPYFLFIESNTVICKKRLQPMLHDIEKTMKSINKVKKVKNNNVIFVDLIIWLGHN